MYTFIVLRENISSIASGGQITEVEAIPLWNSWSTECNSLQVSIFNYLGYVIKSNRENNDVELV